MTKQQIEKTSWAKEFKRECLKYYSDALQFALRTPLFVDIYKTDETGELLWVIQVKETTFWMDGFKTKKEAVALCKEMGWKVQNAEKRKTTG